MRSPLARHPPRQPPRHPRAPGSHFLGRPHPHTRPRPSVPSRERPPGRAERHRRPGRPEGSIRAAPHARWDFVGSVSGWWSSAESRYRIGRPSDTNSVALDTIPSFMSKAATIVPLATPRITSAYWWSFASASAAQSPKTLSSAFFSSRSTSGHERWTLATSKGTTFRVRGMEIEKRRRPAWCRRSATPLRRSWTGAARRPGPRSRERDACAICSSMRPRGLSWIWP